MDLEQLGRMTYWQLSLFCANKKLLGGSDTVSSFAEARALWKERKKKNGNGTR